MWLELGLRIAGWERSSDQKEVRLILLWLRLVRGFKPTWGHETKKCYFFIFHFVLRKEKLDNHTKPSIIPPRVLKGSGVIFFSCFTRIRKIIGAPQRGFSITLFGPPAIKTTSQFKFPTIGLRGCKIIVSPNLSLLKDFK